MKDLYRIFVEGDADKRFIAQLLESIFNDRSEKDQKIAQSTHENVYIKTRKTFWRNSKQLLISSYLTQTPIAKLVGENCRIGKDEAR